MSKLNELKAMVAFKEKADELIEEMKAEISKNEEEIHVSAAERFKEIDAELIEIAKLLSVEENIYFGKGNGYRIVFNKSGVELYRNAGLHHDLLWRTGLKADGFFVTDIAVNWDTYEENILNGLKKSIKSDVEYGLKTTTRELQRSVDTLEKVSI